MMATTADEDRWSFSLIKVRDLPIRVHVTFLIFSALTLLTAGLEQRGPMGNAILGYALLLLAILAGSVLLHELGHLVASRFWGGRWRSAVIAPFGGLGRFDPPIWPHHEMAVYLAGPAVHGAISGVGTLVLIAIGQWHITFLHPLVPEGLLEGSLVLVTLRLLAWTNWVLCLLNLLPIFTGDGVPMLRAFLLYAYPTLSKERAFKWVVDLSRATGVVLLVALLFYWPGLHNSGPWFALMLLGSINMVMGERLNKQLEKRLDTSSSGDASEKERTCQNGPAPMANENVLAENKCLIASDPVSEKRAAEKPHKSTVPDTVSHVSRETERILKVRERERLELMDELLARIAREGIQSLREEELEFLRRCSKR